MFTSWIYAEAHLKFQSIPHSTASAHLSTHTSPKLENRTYIQNFETNDLHIKFSTSNVSFLFLSLAIHCMSFWCLPLITVTVKFSMMPWCNMLLKFGEIQHFSLGAFVDVLSVHTNTYPTQNLLMLWAKKNIICPACAKADLYYSWLMTNYIFTCIYSALEPL